MSSAHCPAAGLPGAPASPSPRSPNGRLDSASAKALWTRGITSPRLQAKALQAENAQAEAAPAPPTKGRKATGPAAGTSSETVLLAARILSTSLAADTDSEATQALLELRSSAALLPAAPQSAVQRPAASKGEEVAVSCQAVEAAPDNAGQAFAPQTPPAAEAAASTQAPAHCPAGGSATQGERMGIVSFIRMLSNAASQLHRACKQQSSLLAAVAANQQALNTQSGLLQGLFSGLSDQVQQLQGSKEAQTVLSQLAPAVQQVQSEVQALWQCWSAVLECPPRSAPQPHSDARSPDSAELLCLLEQALQLQPPQVGGAGSERKEPSTTGTAVWLGEPLEGELLAMAQWEQQQGRHEGSVSRGDTASQGQESGDAEGDAEMANAAPEEPGLAPAPPPAGLPLPQPLLPRCASAQVLVQHGTPTAAPEAPVPLIVIRQPSVRLCLRQGEAAPERRIRTSRQREGAQEQQPTAAALPAPARQVPRGNPASVPTLEHLDSIYNYLSRLSTQPPQEPGAGQQPTTSLQAEGAAGEADGGAAVSGAKHRLPDEDPRPADSAATHGSNPLRLAAKRPRPLTPSSGPPAEGTPSWEE